MKLDRFAKDYGKEKECPHELVKQVALAFLEAIKQEVANAGSCQVSDFGTFKIQKRKEKAARNIKTGERIIVPEHDVVKFVPSTLLLGSIEGLKKEKSK